MRFYSLHVNESRCHRCTKIGFRLIFNNHFKYSFFKGQNFHIRLSALSFFSIKYIMLLYTNLYFYKSMYVAAIPPQHNQIFSSLFQNIEENVQKGEKSVILPVCKLRDLKIKFPMSYCSFYCFLRFVCKWYWK